MENLIKVAVLIGVFCLAISLAHAQEEPEYAYGVVTSASGDQIVISEYDYETDMDVDISFTVTEDTIIDGVGSISDISAGDNAEIDYVVKDGKKIAQMVFIEKSEVSEAEDVY